MGNYWFDIGLITALLLLNGLFAGSEIALISVREGQLRTLERSDGRRERALVSLARDPNRFLGTIQLGITLAGYLASATAAVTLAEPLVPALGVFGGAAEAVAIGSVTIVLAAVNIVVGELAPKRLAMQYAHRWALLVAVPLDKLASSQSPWCGCWAKQPMSWSGCSAATRTRLPSSCRRRNCRNSWQPTAD